MTKGNVPHRLRNLGLNYPCGTEHYLKQNLLLPGEPGVRMMKYLQLIFIQANNDRRYRTRIRQ